MRDPRFVEGVFSVSRIAAASLVSAVATLATAAAADSAMTQTVNGFYGVYATFHPSDGIPDKSARARYAPYLSPALDKLLGDGEAAQLRFAKANKNSPPLIEGDLFSSMFEGATSHKLGDCKGDAKKANCAVNFVYDDKVDPPTRWTDTIYLVMTPGGWRVDDIGYGGNWEYANRGRLSATLRQAIADSGG